MYKYEHMYKCANDHSHITSSTITVKVIMHTRVHTRTLKLIVAHTHKLSLTHKNAHTFATAIFARGAPAAVPGAAFFCFSIACLFVITENFKRLSTCVPKEITNKSDTSPPGGCLSP